jgi:hypothetical protein
LWHDFIPTIGRLALNDQAASRVWGYGYRFLYDGGAMAVTFVMLPLPRRWTSGVVFGVAICLAVIATLLSSARAQALLFPLTPTTALAALGGHLIYGSTLGALLGHGRFAEGGRPCTAHSRCQPGRSFPVS